MVRISSDKFSEFRVESHQKSGTGKERHGPGKHPKPAEHLEMEQVIDEALTTLGVSGQHMKIKDGQWFVAIREEIGYLVRSYDEWGKVKLDSPVGPLPPESDVDKLKALLKFNAVSMMYAGARLYLTSDDVLALTTELSQSGIDGKTLADAFHSLGQAQEVVAAILAGDPDGGDVVSDLTARSQWVTA